MTLCDAILFFFFPADAMHALCGPRAWCLLWPSLAVRYIHTRPGIMMESRVGTEAGGRKGRVEGKSRWLPPALPVPFDRALVAPRSCFQLRRSSALLV